MVYLFRTVLGVVTCVDGSTVPPYLSRTPLVRGGLGEPAGVQSGGGGGPVKIVDCLRPDRARLKAILLNRSGPVVMRQVMAVERKVDRRPEMLGFVRNRGRPSSILFRSPLCFDGTYDGGVVDIERSETAGKPSDLETHRLGLKEGNRACGGFPDSGVHWQWRLRSVSAVWSTCGLLGVDLGGFGLMFATWA